MRTALTATKLAFVAYVIPFMFVLNPAYLLIGTPWEKILAVLTGFFGVIAFGVVFQGYLNQKVGWTQRIWALAAGILVLVPYGLLNIAGVVLIILLLMVSRKQKGMMVSKKTVET